MAVEAGDQYLMRLASFVDANTGALLDGGMLLKLNPEGLHYVQTRLEALRELEELRIGAPVDYLRAYVADLGDYRALEQLRRVLRLLAVLKVAATGGSPSARDPTRVTLLPFSRLRSLELRGCDLSTSAARGLLQLRPTLEKLVCYNSTDALRHIFSERTKEIEGSEVWSRLANVCCYGNGLLLMDESLQLLPAVEALDLSRNRFAKVANLHKCTELKFLDVGFNQISTVASLYKILGTVASLVLRNNALVSTWGLHGLASLEALDLSYNLISSFREVELLGDLPSLRSLWLQGNPLTFRRSYRKETLSYFSDPMKLVLDGRQTSMMESWAARRLVAYREKQRSKYGAFSPAQTRVLSHLSQQSSDFEEFEDDSAKAGSICATTSSGLSVPRARKKTSRLASIGDFTGSLCSSGSLGSSREDLLSSSASLDIASATPDDKDKAERIADDWKDLMQRVEILKRADSISWLIDLNALLDTEGKGKSQILAEVRRMNSKDFQARLSLQRRRRRRSVEKGGFGDSTPALKESEAISIAGELQNEATTSQGRSTPKSSPAKDGGDALVEKASNFPVDGSSLLGMFSRDISFVDERPSDGPGSPYQGGPLRVRDTSGAFKLTEALVNKTLSPSPFPLPQFHQTLLQRRQSLERERLQLLLEQSSAPMYDSESSSGTYLSDSSVSPRHSPPPVRHPFKFGQDQMPKLAPAKSENSDDRAQPWSDTEAPRTVGSDVGGTHGISQPVSALAEQEIEPSVPTVEERGPGGKEKSFVFNEEEGDFRQENSPEEEGAGIQTDYVATAVDADEHIEISDKIAGLSSAGSGGSGNNTKDGWFVGGGTINPLKGRLGESEKRMNRRSPRRSRGSGSQQTKSKALRRIVSVESLPKTSVSPRRRKSSSGDRLEFGNEHQQALFPNITSELSLPVSLGSSGPFTTLSSIKHSSSLDTNFDFHQSWSRNRNQETSLPSTSQIESHEGPDSSLQLHRLQAVGQCA